MSKKKGNNTAARKTGVKVIGNAVRIFNMSNEDIVCAHSGATLPKRGMAWQNGDKFFIDRQACEANG
jgi:predicted ABC-type sugar transport system permease subunit